jgi:hypothetical protein
VDACDRGAVSCRPITDPNDIETVYLETQHVPVIGDSAVSIERTIVFRYADSIHKDHKLL